MENEIPLNKVNMVQPLQMRHLVEISLVSLIVGGASNFGGGNQGRSTDHHFVKYTTSWTLYQEVCLLMLLPHYMLRVVPSLMMLPHYMVRGGILDDEATLHAKGWSFC